MIVLQNTVRRPVAGLSFAPDGRLVAGGSGGFDVWTLADQTCRHLKSHSVAKLSGCVFDPLGRWIYVSDYMAGLRFLRLSRKVPAVPGIRSSFVRSFAVSADGRRLVRGCGLTGSNEIGCWAADSDNGFTHIWSRQDDDPLQPETDHDPSSIIWRDYTVAVNADGSRVACTDRFIDGQPGSHNRKMVVRDGDDGRAIADLGDTDATFQGELAFAPGGTSLFVWDQQLLERWDLAGGRRSHLRKAPGRAYFTGFAVHPGGRFVLTSGGDGLVRFWDADTLDPGRVMKWGIGKLHAVAVSPDGLLAAAGGEKGQVVVWDLDD